MKKLLVICILLLLFIPFVYGEDETYIIVVLEDGTIEKRLVSEFIPEMTLFRMASVLSPVDEAINNAKNQEGIVYAEKIYPLNLEVVSPNSNNDEWRFEAINITSILPTFDFSSSDVRVAVLDTGLNYVGADLVIDLPKDVSTSSITDVDVTSTNDHGTHVAGIIGAKLDGDDIDGIAPGITIVPVKVFTDAGIGDTSYLIKGLEYVKLLNDPDNDPTTVSPKIIHVINMSLSYGNYSQIISDLIDDLELQGVVIVAATGNDSNLWVSDDYDYPRLGVSLTTAYVSEMNFPAGFEKVLAVGSVSKSNSTLLGISDFSNVAGIPTGLSVKTEVDVIAPGESIVSWIGSSSTDYKSGTSMASPHVAGLAAILMNEYPLLAPSDIRYLIRTTSKNDDIEVPSTIPNGKTKSDLIGSGLIQVNNALNFSPIQSVNFNDVTNFVYDETLDSFTGTIPYIVDEVEMTVTLLNSASYKLGSDTEYANLIETITTVDTTTTIVLNSSFMSIPRSQTIVLTKEAPELVSVDFFDGITDLEYTFDLNLDEQFVIIDQNVTELTLVSDADGANIYYDESVTNSTSKSFTMSDDVTVLIKVESPDQIISKTYTLHLIKDKMALSLTDLQVKKDENAIATLSGFDSYILDYDLGDIGNDVEPVLSAISSSTVEYSLNDNAFDSTLDLSNIQNDILQTVKIKVTSGDYYKTYRVTFTRLGSARIENITLTPKAGLDNLVLYSPYTFDENTTDYTIDVSHRMSDLHFVLAMNTDASTTEVFLDDEKILTPLEGGIPFYFESNINTRALTVGTHTLRIETSYNSVTSIYNYTINVMDLTDLTEIYIKADDVNILSFDKDISTYDYVVLDSTLDMTFKASRAEKSYGSMVVSYDALIDEAYDTYAIIDLDYGVPETIVLKITSPIVSESKTYTFNITDRVADTVNTLSALSVSGYSISPTFDSATESYSLSVSNGVSSVAVNATKTSSYSILKINNVESTSQNMSLSVGANTATVLVTAEDNTTKTYTINITRAAAPVDNSDSSSGSDSSSSSGSTGFVPPPSSGVPVVSEPEVAEDTVETQTNDDGTEKSVVTVSDGRVLADIKDDDVKKIEVIVETEAAAEVAITKDILKTVLESKKPLDIKYNNVTFKMTPEVIEGLNIEGDLNVVFESVTTGFSNNKVVSEVYELDILDGVKKATFDVPIPIVLIYDTKNIKNPSNLAIYYYNDKTNEWVYVGGKLLANNEISFEAKHFTKYAIRENDKTFDDIQNHWAKEAIETLASREITSGVTYFDFAPDKTLTNAEFVVLLTKVLSLKDYDGPISFVEVKESDWFEPFFRKAHGAGLLSNTFGARMDPNAPIRREEMASLLMDAYFYYSRTNRGDQLENAVEFAVDEGEVSQHFRDDVRLAYQLQLIVGDTENRFNPQNGATRAEAAIVIKKLLILLDLL